MFNFKRLAMAILFALILMICITIGVFMFLVLPVYFFGPPGIVGTVFLFLFIVFTCSAYEFLENEYK